MSIASVEAQTQSVELTEQQLAVQKVLKATELLTDLNHQRSTPFDVEHARTMIRLALSELVQILPPAEAIHFKESIADLRTAQPVYLNIDEQTFYIPRDWKDADSQKRLPLKGNL